MKLNNRILLTLFCFCLFHSNASFGQVNTENLRKTNLNNNGLSKTFRLNVGYFDGNSNYLKLDTNFRTDFVHDSYYAFGVVEYQRAVQNSKTFINKGFMHARGIHQYSKYIKWELFLQKEFNEFILLNNRELIGTGLRTSVFALSKKKDKLQKNFYVGIGLMWEHEEIDTDPVTETHIIRSTNYLTFLLKADKKFNLGFTGYYQFDVERFSDYRLLAEARLQFKITENFAFNTSMNFRYDSEPPIAIKKHDLELSNGISISF